MLKDKFDVQIIGKDALNYLGRFENVDCGFDIEEIGDFCNNIERIYGFSPEDKHLCYEVDFIVYDEDHIPTIFDYCLVPNIERALKIVDRIFQDWEENKGKIFENHYDRYYTQDELDMTFNVRLEVAMRRNAVKIYETEFVIKSLEKFEKTIQQQIGTIDYLDETDKKYLVRADIYNGKPQVTFHHDFVFPYDDLKVLMKFIERLETEL